MTHDEIKDALSALALGALDPAERDIVQAHVRECAECQAELAVLGRVVDGIGLEAKPVTPPAALKAKVMARVASTPAGSKPAPATVTPMPPKIISSGTGAGGSKVGWAMPLALAASLILAAAAVFYSFSLRREVADLRTAAKVIQSPDLLNVVVKGQDVASGASGRALWSRSSGFVFSAQGLPLLPAGRVYQLWTITGKTPTSAGLMKPDANGTAFVTMPVSPDAPRPDAFGVTIEPAGGSRAPTMPIVMLGASGQ
jgi:anti-sigma-K factor RskA